MKKIKGSIILLIILLVVITPGLTLYEYHDIEDNSDLNEKTSVGCNAYFHETEHSEQMLGFRKIKTANPYIYHLAIYGNFEEVKNVKAKIIVNDNDEYSIDIFDQEFDANRYTSGNENYKYYYESPVDKNIDIDPKEISSLKVQMSFIV